MNGGVKNLFILIYYYLGYVFTPNLVKNLLIRKLIKILYVYLLTYMYISSEHNDSLAV